jgi:hypothetical protein
MNIHQDIGINAMQEAIVNGDDLYQAVNERSITGGSQALTDIFCGAIACLLNSFVSLRNAGVVPANTGDPSIDSFLKSGHNQMIAAVTQSLILRDSKADGYLSPVIELIDENRKAFAFVKEPAPKAEAVQPPQPIDLRVVLEMPKNEAAQPIDVHVVSMPKAEAAQPIDVHVVSMPSRTTEAKVKRDSSGNIISATKIERDAKS